MPSYRMRQSGWGSPNKLLEGENRPNGAIIHYYFKEKPAKESVVKLEILEESGKLIKSFASNAKKKKNQFTPKKGMNRFIWDMRYPDAISFEGLVLYSSNTKGPVAVPKNYKVRLVVDDQAMEQDFEIKMDPRSESTIEDLQAQFDYLIDIRNKLSEAHQAVIDIRSLRKDLDYLKGKLGDKEYYADVRKAIKAFDEEMTVIENNIHETRNEARQDPLNFGIKLNNRLAYLATHEAGGDYRPTDQGIAYKKEVSAQIDKELTDLKTVMDTQIPKLNELMQAKGVKFLMGGVAKP